MGLRIALAVVLALASAPASAQFYKDKTLTILINYAAGGNSDLEARVFQKYLPKLIPGTPNIIIQNQPGAGGINAINMLGNNVGSRPDGLTVGYFTFSVPPVIAEDPSLKTNVADFVVIGGMRSWAVEYGRKDTPPGLTKAADIIKATKVFVGGYSRPTLHDTRQRLALEVLGVPYTMVTGFQSSSLLNKAMLQGEIHLTASTLPGYQTQAVPQLIETGIALPLWQFPAMDRNGAPVSNPALEKQGLAPFDALYKEVHGKAPSGPRWDALLLVNHLGTQLQRLIVLPKGSPMEAARDLRAAFQAAIRDPDCVGDYLKLTNERPDIAPAEDVEPMLARLRNIDPAVKAVVKESLAEK